VRVQVSLLPRAVAATASVALALVAAVTGVAGVNVGYHVQPFWLALAVICTLLTFLSARAATTRLPHPGVLAGATASVLIAGFVAAVAATTPSQPSKTEARATGHRLLSRVPPYPGARITAYQLDTRGPGGDLGPSYLHPPDGYRLSRTELLPRTTRLRDAISYYRHTLRSLRFRVSVRSPRGDVPEAVRDPSDHSLIQIATAGEQFFYVITLARAKRRLVADTTYGP
jgi:hypothetical protein